MCISSVSSLIKLILELCSFPRISDTSVSLSFSVTSQLSLGCHQPHSLLHLVTGLHKPHTTPSTTLSSVARSRSLPQEPLMSIHTKKIKVCTFLLLEISSTNLTSYVFRGILECYQLTPCLDLLHLISLLYKVLRCSIHDRAWTTPAHHHSQRGQHLHS